MSCMHVPQAMFPAPIAVMHGSGTIISCQSCSNEQRAHIKSMAQAAVICYKNKLC